MPTITTEFTRELIEFVPEGHRSLQGLGKMQLEGTVAAFNMLARNRIAYVADEVGTGKTYVALGVMSLLRFLEPTARVAVIAPRENIQRKWIKELRNFVGQNWQVVGNRVKSVQGDPAWEPVYCNSLMDFAREASIHPDRDFFLRMTSFSLSFQKPEARRRLRKALHRIAPWLDYPDLTARSPDDFRTAFGKALNSVVPEIDLLIVDEAHNLKHGFGRRASTRNQVMGLALGRPITEEEEEWYGSEPEWYRHKVKNVLLLSATPFENDYGAIQRQLDVLGMGDARLLAATGSDTHSVRGLLDTKKLVADKRKSVERLLLRRVSGITIGGELHTKNMYRREWRAGGLQNHDQPISITDPRQRLVVALMQKKVAEILRSPEFGNRFQIGMLSSFESFLESVDTLGRSRDSGVDASVEEDDSPVGTFDGDQDATEGERQGIDTGSIAQLADSYRDHFGGSLPHPKLDTTADALASAFETGEKSLVFVRRVRTVDELAGRLDAVFDTWVRDKLETTLPSLKPELGQIFTRYEEERKRRSDDVREDVPLDDKEVENEDLSQHRSYLEDDDPGGAETFFAWFFRGQGPSDILSGARFQKTRLASASSAYATLFEEDYVSWLLGRPADTLAALAAEVDQAPDALSENLRRHAWSHFSHRGKQQDRYPRLYVYEAYQAAALELLEKRADSLSEAAAMILEERFAEAASVGEEPPDGFPGPERGIGITSFITELVKRPPLRNELWPDWATGSHREQFRRREQRRELLSTMCRLGLAYIDLYSLAIGTLGGFSIGAEAQAADRGPELVNLFLDLLERQRSSGEFGGYQELARASEAFDVIVSVNFPTLRHAKLKEISGLYGNVLQRQAPVGRMQGGVNKRLVSQFRMPGFPLVLVSTDVLQEGEDLHTFCKQIIHYGISWTPSAMEQRTGRIDRIGGLVQRHLDGQAERPAPEDLIQVHYPHLQDTVEVLQVRRVFERMNRFMQLIHKTDQDEDDLDSRIDTAKEIIQELRPIEPIRGRLQSAFPVSEPWLAGDLRPGTVPIPKVEPHLRHAEALWKSLLPKLGIEEHRSRPNTFSGTLPLADAGHAAGGSQRLELEMRSQAAGDAVLLRCSCWVGEFNPEDGKTLDRLHAAELALGGARLCARPKAKASSAALSIENDILLEVGATQEADLESLIQRSASAAASITEVLLRGLPVSKLSAISRKPKRSNELAAAIATLIQRRGLDWSVEKTRVLVPLLRGGRQHRVDLLAESDRYIFRALATAPSAYAQTPAKVRDLTYRSWRWNASKEIVDFSVDAKGRLVGVVQQPVKSAHDEELQLYVEALARECDHAEYVLTGRDIK